MKWLLEGENGIDIRMYMLKFLAYVGCICKFESVRLKRVQGTQKVLGGNNFHGRIIRAYVYIIYV
jgi:hypothetical protein